MPTPLYTTTATSTGEGRAGGRAVTDDGLLDVTLAVPAALGGPGGATNPEQLFAAGWASCFRSALKLAAARRKLSVAGSTVVAEISLVPNGADGFALNAVLRVQLPAGIATDVAESLTEAADAVCPYSAAVRGNVPVTLTTTVG